MRKKIVAANWKMNLTLQEGKSLVEGILSSMPTANENRVVVIAPPFVHLAQTANQLSGANHVFLGAQNCSYAASGAFTGEVSAAMLQNVGAKYVILGHSERRGYFHEDSAMLVKKMDQAFQQGLQVIFCCGEPLEIRDAETQNDFVGNQLAEALFHLNAEQLKHVVVAYEPIWAIGTGRTASAAQAQEMHAHIRSVINHKFGIEAAENLSILYGGSCNAQNASELFTCPDVDGGLIGGAALKADSFVAIIDAMLHA